MAKRNILAEEMRCKTDEWLEKMCGQQRCVASRDAWPKDMSDQKRCVYLSTVWDCVYTTGVLKCARVSNVCLKDSAFMCAI